MNSMPSGWIIAIDGPAGSGKSSAARLLAKKLGCLYLETGALYRAVGLQALKEGLDLHNPDDLGKLCARLELTARPAGGDDETAAVYVNGRNVTDEIRTPEVSRAAAAVAAVPAVRHRLLDLQREIGRQGGRRGGVVVEGRDIGTVVFPEAPIKFFLSAAPDVRVERRYKELRAQGLPVDRGGTRKEIDTRDLKDSGRPIAPLRPASDAVRIDSTALTLEEVVSTMMEAIQARTGDPSDPS